MSESTQNIRRKMNGATNIESVVRIMKVIASSNIYRYERAVTALDEYYDTIKLSLEAYFREGKLGATMPADPRKKDKRVIGAIVFGAEQGLVGQFNDVIAEYTIEKLSSFQNKIEIWTVGQGVYESLAEAGLPVAKLFSLPNSVRGITPLVGDVLLESERRLNANEFSEFYIFYNCYSKDLNYVPVAKRLLPLDEIWLKELVKIAWPTKYLPEVIGDPKNTLLALIHEYLFVAVFRACAESLAAENASRLATVQRADKNIGEMLEELTRSYQNIRQNTIDEEMFDIISGFETVSKKK